MKSKHLRRAVLALACALVTGAAFAQTTPTVTIEENHTESPSIRKDAHDGSVGAAIPAAADAAGELISSARQTARTIVLGLSSETLATVKNVGETLDDAGDELGRSDQSFQSTSR